MTERRDNIARFEMRSEVLIARIRALAADSSNIRWSHHARRRMAERDITIRTAMSVLQQGVIVGPVDPGDGVGEWKAKVVRRRKGQRDVGVVAVVIREHSILVKTVEWEDVR